MSLARHLGTLGVIMSALERCEGDMDTEWKVIKKAWFKRVRATHPDKGGDPAEFRMAQTAFEVLRGAYDSKRVTTFANARAGFYGDGEDYEEDDAAAEAPEEDQAAADAAWSEAWGRTDGAAPSYAFYEAAEAEEMPSYRVELAKTKRGKCQRSVRPKNASDRWTSKCQCDSSGVIPKGEIKIGSLDRRAGCYGRFVHLGCWKVPSKIWLGLPAALQSSAAGSVSPRDVEQALIAMNEILFCGFTQLSDEQRGNVVRHTMESDNWAKQTKCSVCHEPGHNKSTCPTLATNGGLAPYAAKIKAEMKYATKSIYYIKFSRNVIRTEFSNIIFI